MIRIRQVGTPAPQNLAVAAGMLLEDGVNRPDAEDDGIGAPSSAKLVADAVAVNDARTIDQVTAETNQSHMPTKRIPHADPWPHCNAGVRVNHDRV